MKRHSCPFLVFLSLVITAAFFPLVSKTAGAAVKSPPNATAHDLAQRYEEYQERSRTNRIVLDKPRYTNAPCSRASLQTGDLCRALMCDEDANDQRRLEQAASNGCFLAMVALAIDTNISSSTNFWLGRAKSTLPQVRTAADKRDPPAQFALGVLYAMGWLVQSNANLSMQLARMAGSYGFAPAQMFLGDSAETQKNYAEAVRWYSLAATQGLQSAQVRLTSLHSVVSRGTTNFSPDPCQAVFWTFEVANQLPCWDTYSACCTLAEAYDEGKCIEPDPAAALRWLTYAADMTNVGHGRAEYLIALHYFGGEGVAQSDADGTTWLQKARRKGYKDDTNLEEQIAESAFQAHNYPLAIKYYRKFASDGDPQGQDPLGLCYRFGLGVAKDDEKAEHYWKLAAEQGAVGAQYMLGTFYLDMHRYKEGVELLRKAADTGDSSARLILADCYYHGQGVPQDYAEAVKVYKQKAEQGNGLAQQRLADAYRDGKGVRQDFVEAYKWYNLASASPDFPSEIQDMYSKCRDDLAGQMTPSQVAEAQRLSREFQAQPASGNRGREAGPDASPAASATGFFITDDGYLVTSQHVVADAKSIRIRTGRTFLEAELVNTDPANDLALLKVKGRFTPLPIKSSRDVRLGETVVTIGFPNPGLLGSSPKLSRGEISSLAGVRDDPKHFQISLPIQPGNSGGPLLDLSGCVVGVVAAKLSQRAALTTTGALAENVNYAVKSSFILGFLESLPSVSSRLKPPRSEKRQIDDLVTETEKATVQVLVY